MYVKVSDGGERFWCKVIEIKNGIVFAVVDNHLIDDHGFNYGDSVEFPVEFIIDTIH